MRQVELEQLMKNGSDQFSNFMSSGSANSVLDPVVTNGDAASCSGVPPKKTPPYSGYTGNQEVVLRVTLALITIADTYLPIISASKA